MAGSHAQGGSGSESFLYVPGPGVDVAAVDAGVAQALERGLIEPGTGQRTRLVARLAGGGSHSGQRLADELAVSRAAVHKHVEHLRRAGVGIASAPGAGYVLDSIADLLLPEAVLPLLLSRIEPGADAGRGQIGLPGLPYAYSAYVGSTNDVMKERANAGAPAGCVVVTDDQRGGKGRLGRTWISEPNKDLTFTVLARPRMAPAAVTLMVLAAAVAVADTLGRLPGLEGAVGVKWPNDVIIGGRKVCGVLSETSIDMDAVHWLAVGVGLNVNGAPQSRAGAGAGARAAAGGAVPPGSLREAAGRPVARRRLLVELLVELGRRFGGIVAQGPDEMLDDFRRLDVLRGREVQVWSGPEPRSLLAEGTAEGIGGSGELVVRRPDGSGFEAEFGEVTVRT